MTDERLSHALEELHHEISRLEDLDATSRQRLLKLTEAIKRKLEQPQDVEQHLHLVGLLQDEEAYFEVSHPKLAMALNEVLTILSAAGI